MSYVFVTRLGDPFRYIEGKLMSRNNEFLNSTTLYDAPVDALNDELNKTGDAVFYVSAVLVAFMGIFCTIGNGLVLYISNKNQDFGGFQEVNWVVKNLAMSDCLFGVFGCPLTIVWWYWGQFGPMSNFAIDNEDWKSALLRGFYFQYQNASAYFVFLIVALRLHIVRNPLGPDKDLLQRITRICCTVIWCLCIIINFLPIAASIPLASQEPPCNPRNMTNSAEITECMKKIGETKSTLTACWLTVLHAGITVPLALTIVTNILLIISVRKMKHESESTAKKRNWQRLERLTNGVVLSLIICNVPYIAWYHWSLNLYMKTGRGWDGISGILFTGIARFLVTANSSLNPMVYATTIPNFKNTIRKIRKREYTKEEDPYTLDATPEVTQLK